MGIQINGQTDTISSTDGSLNIGGTVTVNVTGDATGLTGTPNITVGVVTASSAVISGDLTVNGTTTTLDTTLTEVDKLEVGANNTTVGVAITQSGSGDILRLYDSSTQVVTVADGGNFGIRETNPEERLHIGASPCNIKLANRAFLGATYAQVGTVLGYMSKADTTNSVLDQIIQVGTGGNGAAALLLSQGSAKFFTNSSATDGAVLSTERLRIDSSGDLRAYQSGTNGNTRTLNFEVYGGTAPEGNGVIEFKRSRSSVADTQTAVVNNVLGQIKFSGSDGTSFGEGARIEAKSFSTWSGSDRATELIFHVTPDSSTTLTEAMRIRYDGNVGIGTINPGTRLHVETTSQVALRLRTTNSSTANPSIQILDPTGAKDGLFTYTNDGIAVGSYTAHPLSFIVQNSERARIDTSGRLLVGNDTATTGTNNQYSRLQIIGGASGAAWASMNLCRNENSADISLNELLGEIYFCDKQAGEYAKIKVNCDGTAAGSGDYPGRIEFHTTTDGASSPTERMRITSSSGTQIRIVGSTSADSGAFKFVNSSQDTQWQIATNSTNFYIADSDFSHYAYLSQNPVAWQWASDARLKENIVDIGYGIETVKQLQPRQFSFIGNSETVLGFVAQELQPIVPEAVSGVEQEFLDTDTPEERAQKTLGVAKDTLIPVLVKALQEVLAKIETLEQRLNDAGIA